MTKNVEKGLENNINDILRTLRDQTEQNKVLVSVNEELTDANRELRHDLGISRRQATHYKKTSEEQKERAEHFREERDLYETQVEDLTAKLSTTQQNNTILTERLTAVQKSNSDLNERLVRTTASLKYLEGQIKELEQTINDKETKLADSDERINDAYTVIKQKNSRLNKTRMGLCAVAVCTLLFGYVAGIGSGSTANVKPTLIVQTVEQPQVVEKVKTHYKVRAPDIIDDLYGK